MTSPSVSRACNSNAVLRTGLDQLEAPPSAARPRYHLRPVALRPRLPNMDNIADVLAVAEGEDYRDFARFPGVRRENPLADAPEG